MSNKQIAIDYCNDVITNKISACKYIIQSCQLFLNNLQRTDLFFNENEVDMVCTFINCLDLSEQTTPKKFILQPWQTFCICGIYGFYYSNTNKRKVNTVFLELPRKNGKSQLIIALAMYELLFTKDSQVVLSANSREQAKNVDFKKTLEYCKQLDEKKKFIKPLYSKVKFQNSELIVTASDSKRLDGLNASLCIIDELHEAKNANMYNVLKSSQGSRPNPLLIAITTAGFDSESFCYTLVDYSMKVLDGTIIDDSQFNLIYTIDIDDDYTDYKNIEKANPNLGISVNKSFIIDEIKKSIQNPVEAFNTKVKYFNIWMTSKNYDEQYIDMQYVDKIFNREMKITDEKFKQYDGVYIGVDLAARNDILAVTYMFVLDGKYNVFNRYYLSKDNANSVLTNQMYTRWAQQGYIKMIEGQSVDYVKDIIPDIEAIAQIYNINLMSYDPWNAEQFAKDCTARGWYLQPYGQGFAYINKPAKELSRLVMLEQIEIEYNPVTKWMFSNCIVKEYNENIKVVKYNKNNKIDGVISLITILGGYMSLPNYGFNVY